MRSPIFVRSLTLSSQRIACAPLYIHRCVLADSFARRGARSRAGVSPCALGRPVTAVSCAGSPSTPGLLVGFARSHFYAAPTTAAYATDFCTCSLIGGADEDYDVRVSADEPSSVSRLKDTAVTSVNINCTEVCRCLSCLL